MYRAVIFDFFDVIHRDPFVHWMKQNKLEWSDELDENSQLMDIGAIDDAQFYKRLSDLTGQPLKDIKAIFDDTGFIDKDMVTLIKQLKQTYKTGLLSNSSTEYIRQILGRHELESLFNVITVSAEVRLIKPDPRIFEYILGELGVKAVEAIFIDDNPRNVKAADGLGITGIVYKDIESLKKELATIGIAI